MFFFIFILAFQLLEDYFNKRGGNVATTLIHKKTGHSQIM